MSSDLIKPLLDTYQVYGINFKKNKSTSLAMTITILSLLLDMVIRHFNHIGSETDLYVSKGKVRFDFPNLLKIYNRFTCIAKYKVVNWRSGYQLIPFRGMGGTDINLTDKSNRLGIWNNYNDSYSTYGSAIGTAKNTTYEIAVEIQRNNVKLWLNGVLKVNSKRTMNIFPFIECGDNYNNYETNLTAYYNDILVTDAIFLPNNYTVNWNDTWYEIHHKQVYNHTSESFWIPK